MIDSKKYCNNLFFYSRYKTREVYIGDIPLGANNPIRIQSMTTTDTMNTLATVEQAIRMVKARCEYVRITAPSINEAYNLKEIKNVLKKRGFNVPLIADIHFTPNAAEVSARIVEKVRINPGNYADKKKFNLIEYTDAEYKNELERISLKFTPLVKICKEYGTAIRIGVNHGSLSDRIMSRYGDTPLGMVESAMEFIRICEENNFYNIVLSMKSSNPQVMVQAYRLLINAMGKEGMNYPLHLGVTEAGGGEDGRIKSAMGIGTLLEDGLGDTIRVSLTEEPEFEAPVAISLAKRYEDRKTIQGVFQSYDSPINPFEYSRRKTFELIGVGGSNVPKVIADFSNLKKISLEDFKQVGYEFNLKTDKWFINDISADFIYLGLNQIPFSIPPSLKLINDFSIWKNLENKFISYPLFSSEEYLSNSDNLAICNFVKIQYDDLNENFINELKNDKRVILVLECKNQNGIYEHRKLFYELEKNEISNPVIIKKSYKGILQEELTLFASTDFGSMFLDGFGDGVWLSTSLISLKDINRILFSILQFARVRISKTEYIACPSCGRTLFNLQETTEKIKKRTEHLKGVKIAVMGCIVNGPGEMADADFGYVGSGFGKITLYKGKEIIKKNIPEKDSVEELINLIKLYGAWVEPK